MLVIQRLEYDAFGEPPKVLKIKEHHLAALQNDEVLVKILAAPINPSDMLTIQGLYGTKPSLPANGGSEGVGEVIGVGGDVKKVRKGDWVVPLTGPTWSTHLVAKEGDLLPIPKMDVRSAATFKVNPPTAYRLLHDYVHLTPADVIIQNAANSAVGQAVIQIARARGVKTINVVRPRPDLDQLKAELQAMGADYVVTEEELTDLLKSVAAPKLALDCVGGKSTIALTDALAPNGTMVTYGSASKQPVEVSTLALVFRNITLHGFWLTRWFKEPANRGKIGPMYGELSQMILEGKLKAPEMDVIPFRDFDKAFTQALKMKGGAKQLLLFEEACVLKM